MKGQEPLTNGVCVNFADKEIGAPGRDRRRLTIYLWEGTCFRIRSTRDGLPLVKTG